MDEAGGEAVEDLARGILAEPDGGPEIVGGGDAVVGGDAGVIGFFELREADFILASFAFEELAADFDGALALVLIEPMADFVAGAGAFDEGEPVAAGGVAVLGNDFDDVAVAKLCAQWNHAAVDARADAGVPDFGVDGVGEV